MRDSNRPADAGPGHDTLDADILAALWEQVPFPRLPIDAPAEIKELIINIENPKRVYTIHCATRRHNLQLLVEKFIVQLRHGCGVNTCSTSSCFSCRKRVAGKTPVRRYSPTSARTLAVYLASQDNPESRLCPHLQTSARATDAVKPLMFGPKYIASTSGTGKARPSSKNKSTTSLERSSSGTTVKQRLPRDQASDQNGQARKRSPRVASSQSRSGSAHLRVSEKAVSKDYRSFAANVFGTVAFKMLEWLTPSGLEAMSDKAEAVDGSSELRNGSFADSSSSDDEDIELHGQSSVTAHKSKTSDDGVDDSGDLGFDPLPPNGASNGSAFLKSHDGTSTSATANSRNPSAHSRRNSSTRIRTSSGSKPQVKITVDPLLDSVADDTDLVSPSFQTTQSDKVSKDLIRSTSTIGRATPQLSSQNVLDTIADGHESDGRADDIQEDKVQTQVNGALTEETSSSEETPRPVHVPENNQAVRTDNGVPEETSEFDCYLPQSLSRFSLQAVDFLCNVLQDDATSEVHVLEPPSISGSLRRSSSRPKMWKRKHKSNTPYPYKLKLQWKLFVEQSIYSVLSDPRAVLESFTNTDGTFDSQTLWYCMLRLTRVAPSLVFDSLWMALASAFSPPKQLLSSRSPTAKVFPKSPRALSNTETASLMSICFHALVAAAPLVNDSRQLNDMSRIRSHGLSLAGSGAIARQPISLCLKYEDAFTDNMALRLARRLFTAIPTRRYFDELAELDMSSDEAAVDRDVVEILLSSIESATTSSSHFTKAERSLHEKRVPILLLDWARAIMLLEWEGRAVVPGDGPFGAALSLIAAMYRRRQSLLLGDVHFRAEYFGDRLDSVEMPVSWLSFTSAKQKTHLLDYPYLFNPASLISYFRSINFSRMSRAYEESSSLQGRINAIIAPDSLVTEIHQRNVLQDLLKVPAAKYLILDIGRKSVLQDAFDQLWRREERELMRPLKIHLGEESGEEGFDSGGVQQEFFRLAVAEALDPGYGGFIVDERTRMTWFQPGSLQPEWKFELVGLLISLAVYNGLTLPITFPKALYQKLLGEPVTELHHIADGWPDLANGLTNVLEWNEKDGAVEDTFVLTYEFPTSMFEQPITRQMEDVANRESWPQFSAHPNAESLAASNPSDAPLVTADNRNAYVSDYIRYLTDVSIAPQYDAFARGFLSCLQPKSLQLLTPTLLQSIVEGTQEIDINELRRTARYVGWDSSHRTVRDFWSVVKKYDEGMRRKLLEFVTASDRVPVGGMANVQFVVQKNGEEEGEGGHLPTAYTCYGTLLLPEYRDKDVLRERLAMALENAQGFGFA